MPGLDPSRTAVISAVVLAVLYALAVLVVPSPPDVNAGATEIQEYFTDHGDSLRLSSLFFVLGGVPYLVFIVTLRRRINAKCSLLADSAFAGGLLLGAAAIVATMGRLGLALHGREMDPATAKTIYDLLAYFEPVATGPVMLLAGATWLAALRQHVFPAWVGYVSLGYAAFELIEAFTVIGTDGAFAPGDAINTIGTLAFVPWAVAVAVGLARPAPITEPAPAVAG